MGGVFGKGGRGVERVERAAEAVVVVAEDVAGVARDVAEAAQAVETANPVALVKAVEGLAADGRALVKDLERLERGGPGGDSLQNK